jgi:hypothetical protein
MSLVLSGTDGLSDIDGSAATPAIRGTDANTGIFFPAADTIGFSEGGAECARFDSSGNFGLGVTPNPINLGKSFEIGIAGSGLWSTGSATDIRMMSNVYYNAGYKFAGTGYAAVFLVNGGQFVWQRSSASGTVGNAVTASDVMTLDASGNLLVGTTSNSTLASAQGLYLRGSGTDNATYGLNNGTTSAFVSLALFYSSYSTANQTKFEVTSDGSVKSRTNSYAGFSDARLKQGVTPASTQWNDIKNIEVVKFQMKSEQFSDEENPWMLGVIAQQVEQVSPGLVDEDVKDGMKTVKYSILYMKAVKALQEAMERIEQLETRITALESA